ncbi:type VI secretion system tip protein TssI/VgrG [Sorangium sp. So ce726]|uniref:type VI secretion system Vgr family protein n=1 Tax=Sorangium sp. So ce726 TaxID=3133319 RepID=UPI003F6240A2
MTTRRLSDSDAPQQETLSHVTNDESTRTASRLSDSDAPQQETLSHVTNDESTRTVSRLAASDAPQQEALSHVTNDRPTRSVRRLADSGAPQQETLSNVTNDESTRTVNRLADSDAPQQEPLSNVTNDGSTRTMSRLADSDAPQQEPLSDVTNDGPTRSVRRLADSGAPQQETLSNVTNDGPTRSVRRLADSGAPQQEPLADVTNDRPTRSVRRLADSDAPRQETLSHVTSDRPTRSVRRLADSDAPQQEPLADVTNDESTRTMRRLAVSDAPQQEPLADVTNDGSTRTMRRLAVSGAPQQELPADVTNDRPTRTMRRLAVSGAPQQELPADVTNDRPTRTMSRLAVSGAPQQETLANVTNDRPTRTVSRLADSGAPRQETLSHVTNDGSTGTVSKLADSLNIRLELSGFSSDLLQVSRLSGREAISQLFTFDVEVVCPSEDGVDGQTFTGESIAIVFEQNKVEVRRVHGMVAEVHDMLANLRDHRAYRLHIVPRAYRLALVETTEISMNKAVPDLIKQKLELVGLSGSDVELRLAGTYAPREFVVQYQETDLAFISRLAEHAGISFFFEHQDGQDTMVFTDGAGFEPAAGAESVQFRENSDTRDVFELEARSRLVPSVYVARDYNYRQPMLDLTSEHVLPTGYAGGVVEYGGHYKTPAEGKALAQVRAEERQATQLVYAGRSAVSGLGAGARSTLEGHPNLESLDLLFVEVEHRATLLTGRDEPRRYVNTFRAIPGQNTYRPPRVTPTPRIGGVVTGIVDAGPGGGGNDAQIDDQGRYMVRFLFDTGAAGGVTSRPVRMLQNHAGANYGTHFPLKPGTEVLIAFVNGDPDRPVIVGAAPNPLTPSPVNSANRSTHRIKTQGGIVFDLVDE